MLGEELVEVDVEVLLETGEGTWIRYSHSSMDAVDAESEAAIDALNAACGAGAATHVILQPGDRFIVSNRTALHGRAEVGGELGSTSRWLMRGYGLKTQELTEAQRYAASPFMLCP